MEDDRLLEVSDVSLPIVVLTFQMRRARMSMITGCSKLRFCCIDDENVKVMPTITRKGS